MTDIDPDVVCGAAFQGELPLEVYTPSIGRDELGSKPALMLLKFFALDVKDAQSFSFTSGTPDQSVTIEVSSDDNRVASQTDKKLLTFILSLAAKQSQTPGRDRSNRDFGFMVSDWVKALGNKRCGQLYQQLDESLTRLQRTRVVITRRVGRKQYKGSYVWLENYHTVGRAYTREDGVEANRLERVQFRLCEWLHLMINADPSLIRYDRDFLNMRSNFLQRVYEIAMASIDDSFRIDFDELMQRHGGTNETKKFKRSLVQAVTKFLEVCEANGSGRFSMPSFAVYLYDKRSPEASLEGWGTSIRTSNLAFVFVRGEEQRERLDQPLNDFAYFTPRSIENDLGHLAKNMHGRDAIA